MTMHIRNLTNRPVWLTLTSGQTVRLSPGETSAALDEVEVRDNAKLSRMVAQRMIAIDGVTSPSADTGEGGAEQQKFVSSGRKPPAKKRHSSHPTA